jgi:hypothetical protein
MNEIDQISDSEIRIRLWLCVYHNQFGYKEPAFVRGYYKHNQRSLYHKDSYNQVDDARVLTYSIFFLNPTAGRVQRVISALIYLIQNGYLEEDIKIGGQVYLKVLKDVKTGVSINE